MTDKRVDPATGSAVTYTELVATYKKQYRRREIEDLGLATLCVLTRSNKHTQADCTWHLVKHCLILFAYRAVQSRLAEDYWETCKPAKSKKSKAAAPTKESKPSKAAKPEPKAKAKAKAKAAAKDGKKEEKPKPKAKAAPKPETKMDDKAPGVSSVHILQPVHWPAGCSAHSMVCCAKTGGGNTHCAELIGCLQFFKGGESPTRLS